MADRDILAIRTSAGGFEALRFLVASSHTISPLPFSSLSISRVNFAPRATPY